MHTIYIVTKAMFAFNYDVSEKAESCGKRGSHNPTLNSVVYDEMSTSDVSKVLRILERPGEYLQSKMIVDAGCGAGKVILQTFEERKEFDVLIGIELVSGRYNLAVKNLKNLAKYLREKNKYIFVDITFGSEPCFYCKMSVKYPLTGRTRVVIFYNDDIFNNAIYSMIMKTDVIILAVKILEIRSDNLIRLLSKIKCGCRGYFFNKLTIESFDYLNRIHHKYTFNKPWLKNGMFWERK